MDFYGDLKTDYSQIFDFVVVPYDDFILQNLSKFIVDTVTKEPLVKTTAVSALDKYKKQKAV